MKPGDIFLGQFPFGDTPGMKLRPLLLLSPVTGPFAEVLVAYISSVIPAELLATDLLLDPATAIDKATNLKTRSIVRLHKLATIHHTSLVRFLGRISAPRLGEAHASLRAWLTI